MKENQNKEISPEKLIDDETGEKDGKSNNKEINLTIFDYDQKKLENFKLLNEEEEILLCKEEAINDFKLKKKDKGEEIKIKELFKGEDNDSFYYLNKIELRKKYYNIEENLNEDFENVEQIIDNKNDDEMEKLYNEIQLKHPRKIIDNKITRYSFFSWSGFFCCNKPEYISLGEAYITYFNTIKLLIIFFLVLALINSPLISLFRSFTSIYNLTEEDILLNTTLGNTVIRYFNTSVLFYEYYNESLEELDLPLDCGENIFEEILLVQRKYNVENFLKFKGINKNELYNFEYMIFSGNFLKIINNLNFYFNSIYHDEYYNETTKILTFDTFWTYDIYEPFYYESFMYELPDNITDIFYYSCRLNIYPKQYDIEDKESKLQAAIIVITLLSLIISIIFYYSYKKAISTDKKDFQKNKFFINNYTLVLHNLKINSDDFNLELNDLI